MTVDEIGTDFIMNKTIYYKDILKKSRILLISKKIKEN
jgi:hypothetical protein